MTANFYIYQHKTLQVWRNSLHLLAVISTMTAFAQTEPAIELQAEVDGNTRTFTIGLATEGTVQIDWGNGEKVTSEVIPAYDGYNQVNVFGTVSGDGKVKSMAITSFISNVHQE